MLDDGALAVSIPAPEWKSTRPKGSVFFRRDISSARFSPPLVLAIDLVSSACAHAGFEPVFIARPEIFTHGESLAWLMAKLGPVRDHLSLSDGATIKLVPGLRNHVFFYGLSRSADTEGLDRLTRRFPELFDAVQSQVNSALRLGAHAQPAAPVAIEGRSRSGPLASYYPIAFPGYSPSERSKSSWLGAPHAQLTRGFEEVTYVPLTESSLGDPDFMRTIGALYDATYFAPSRALVLRVPEIARGSTDLEDRLEDCLTALVESGSRAPLARARNAWLASDDVPPSALAATASAAHFLAHDTFDFWRSAPSDYHVFRSRKVVARRRRNVSGEFEHLIEALCGVGTEILWRDIARDGSDAFAPPGSPQ